jgi:hypothetical protein
MSFEKMKKGEFHRRFFSDVICGQIVGNLRNAKINFRKSRAYKIIFNNAKLLKILKTKIFIIKILV